MKTSEIRSLFIDYFVKNQHKEIESSNLVPHNDDTLLFTNSGMVQFKNIFTGVETRDYKRATSAQKCLRAGGKHNDLDNVGYTARHHTFFEMLGNFSFGDYFKEQAIKHAWELLTKVYGLPKDKLLVTVYHTDDEAFSLWKSIAGLPESKIIRIKTNDNFWEMGDTGPCGPCTEIFYDHGEGIYGGPPGSEDEDGDRFIEIWNLVFMQHEKVASGELLHLKKPSIDTGMGLERLTAVLQGKHDNYEIDLFNNIINYSSEILKQKITKENKNAFKVIADHLRAVSFMLADGIMPSNEGRGYVLRRILRRAVRYSYILGAKEPVIYKLFSSLKQEMGSHYKELVLREDFIVENIKQEEIKFGETFENGYKILTSELQNNQGSVFSGKTAFKLYDTYGFPVDLTQDILRSKNISIDKKEFDEAFENHKNLARKSWKGSGENKEQAIWFDLGQKIAPTEFIGYESLDCDATVLALLKQTEHGLQEVNSLNKDEKGFLILNKTPFYAEMGGQIGDIGVGTFESGNLDILDTKKKNNDIYAHEIFIKNGILSISNNISLKVSQEFRNEIKRHHSAAHLIHEGLRKILGSHVTQQGSLVSNDRLRFDISHNKAISLEEIEHLEKLINNIVLENIPVKIEYMETTEAISKGAMALFSEKYPKVARTVKIQSQNLNYNSFELCGGTHVESTGEIGFIKIISESSVASSVRRIEAVCGKAFLEYNNQQQKKVKDALKPVTGENKNLNIDYDIATNKIISIQDELASYKRKYNDIFSKYYYNILEKEIICYKEIQLLLTELKSIEVSQLRDISSLFTANKQNILVAFYIVNNDKASFLINISKDLEDKINLSKYSKSILSTLEGTGGGSKTSIQGVFKTTNVNNFNNVIKGIIEPM
jgi:alanyl-tRNA synthetase